MITITPINFNQKNKSIPFEKTRKEIIAEAAPNKELQNLIKEATIDLDSAMIWGIPDLLEYSQRGKTQKAEVTSILKDIIESEEMQKRGLAWNFFHGVEGHGGIPNDDGYLSAYEKLTGIKLDVDV